MVPDRLLGQHRWRNVAYIMIAISLVNMALVAGLVVQRETNIKQGRELAVLQAERRARLSEAASEKRRKQVAENATRVGTCFTQARTGVGAQRIIDGLLTIATTNLEAARNAVRLQPYSPLTPRRKMTVRALAEARRSLVEFSETTRKNTPSVTSCKKLARQLGVNPKTVQQTAEGGGS